jgi:glyoxylase-like metal-dependent hydrolase (beta-lactamase superfamily II)
MILADKTAHLRALKPFPFVYAFYDGRVPDARLFGEDNNWLDNGGYVLGTASYAIVDDDDALIYDTNLSIEHGLKIRRFIEALGVKRMRVVTSHWHLDHVVGNAAFSDCEIIANTRTLAHLEEHRVAIEAGTFHGPPAIAPLVLPNVIYETHLRLEVGRIPVDLHLANIHSDDETVLHLDDFGLLFAADTMEDTVTYVAEPKALDTHLSELDRLWGWNINKILPNHGDPDVIASGGYLKTFIRATQQYVRGLKRCVTEPELRETPFRDFIAGPLQTKWVNYFEPYEAVHRSNVKDVVSANLS